MRDVAVVSYACSNVARDASHNETEMIVPVLHEAIEKTDPRGKLYYWIGGEDPTWEHDELSDFNAVSDGYVSVTPLMLELTDYRAIVEMESWGLKLAGTA